MTLKRWFQDYRRKRRSDRLYAQLSAEEKVTYPEQVGWFLLRMSKEVGLLEERSDWSAMEAATEPGERAWEYGRVARRAMDKHASFTRNLEERTSGVARAAFFRALFLYKHRFRPGFLITTPAEAQLFREETERRLDPRGEWQTQIRAYRDLLNGRVSR